MDFFSFSGVWLQNTYVHKNLKNHRKGQLCTADFKHKVVTISTILQPLVLLAKYKHDRASTNFQNQEVQDFQPSKFGSEANETWTMKHQKISFFSGFKRSYK